MKYQINESLCTGCGLCVNICPVEAITISDIAKIDIDRCIGCGECADVCKKGAVTEVTAETVQENVHDNVPVPAAIVSGIATVIGFLGDTIKQYRNSSASTVSRKDNTGREGGGGRGSGSGRGGMGRGMNKKNKRRR